MSKKKEMEAPTLYNQFDALNKIIKLSDVMEKAALDQHMYFSAMSAETMLRGSISTGSLALDLALGGGHAPGRFTYFFGPTGSGKCFGKDTPVLMYDGRIKAVQDVCVGDLVMGDDSTPRTVLSLARGKDALYRVTPVKGDAYTVNKAHVLSLKDPEDQVVDVPVSEWLDWSASQKQLHKGYRAKADFVGARKDLPLESYFLGMWLGAGTSTDQSIMLNSEPLVDYLHEYAGRLGLEVGVRADYGKPDKCYYLTLHKTAGLRNLVLDHMQGLEVLDNKNVPFMYKTNSADVRAAVLAGILDASGSYIDGEFQFDTPYESLRADVLFLARSLGFAAHSSVRNAEHRLVVTGDFTSLPLKRHLNVPKPLGDVLATGIILGELGQGDYYGFSLDGNHRFLLGDFTVTHNSTVLYQSLKDPLDRNIPAVFLDYEASTDPSYLQKLGVDLIAAMGKQNKKGDWVVEPKLRFSQPSTIEQGTRYIHALCKQFPDKVLMMDGDVPRFFLISPVHVGKYRLTWDFITENLGKTIFEVEDGSPQAVIFLDSIQAMTPKTLDDDSDDNSIALAARALSRGFNLFKSLLGDKMINLIATNGVSINPMAKFGNPETEPGGKTVQYLPDMKVHLNCNRAMGKIIEEPNVEAGIDRYMLGTATIRKNKMGPVFRKVEYRIWLDDAGEPRGGFDPVFDMHTFLSETGQIADTKIDKTHAVKILIPGFDDAPLTIPQFKEFVLTNERAPLLHKAARDQIRSGKAQEMYYDVIKDRKTVVQKRDKKGFGTAIGHEAVAAAERGAPSSDLEL